MKNQRTFLLRLPTALHKQLHLRAEASGLSLNQYIRNRLESGAGHRLDSITRVMKLLPSNGLIGAVLYGSRVRGDATASSDTDVLAVLHPSVAIDRALYRKIDSEILNSDPQLSVQLVHLPDSSTKPTKLWLEVALEGEILHDPTGAVRRHFSHLKHKISEGTYQRKLTYGQPYWTQNEKP